jgi:hypothetical protein
VIAEIVSLSGYESQVSALLNEDQRMEMEFYIACAPEDHPVIPGTRGFRKARWARRSKAAAFVWFTSFWPSPDGFTCLRFTPNRDWRPFRQPIEMYSQELRRRSREQQKEGGKYERADCEHTS